MSDESVTESTRKPILCKNCRERPWNGGPELWCSVCVEDRADLLSSLGRGDIEGDE